MKKGWRTRDELIGYRNQIGSALGILAFKKTLGKMAIKVKAARAKGKGIKVMKAMKAMKAMK